MMIVDKVLRKLQQNQSQTPLYFCLFNSSKELEIPVHALITMKDLMNYLDAKGEKDALAKMEAYRVKYGV